MSSGLCREVLVPPGLGADHGVQDREPLAHAGGEGDLLRFAGGEKLDGEGADDRVAPRRDGRAHGQRGPDGGAAAPDEPSAAPRAAVPGKGGDADEGRDLAAREAADRRQEGPTAVRLTTRPTPGGLRSRSSVARQTGLAWTARSMS